MDLNSAKVIDISRPMSAHHYQNNLPQKMLDHFAGRPIGFEIDTLLDRNSTVGQGQLVRGVKMRLHAGTHIDAPEHWVEGGKPINELPLSLFMGEAVVADFTGKADKAITEQDLEKAVGDAVKPGTRLLIRTGWNDRFFGLPHKDGPMGLAEWKKDSPYFTGGAIAWCIKKKLAILGIDFMHTAHEPGAHHDDTMEPVLVKAGVLTLTNLCNMTAVTRKKVYLMALPLSLQNVEAGPTRAVVFEEAGNG